MRTLFTGAVAAVLAITFAATSPLAQEMLKPGDPALQKALDARAKTAADAAKGNRRAVEAETKLKADAAAQAPAFIAAKQLPCTPTETASRATVGDSVILEFACREGIGYLAYGKPDASNAQVQECIPARMTPMLVACTLPANADAHKALQPYIAKAGVDCTAANANLLGSTATIAAYEVACANGTGQILTITQPRNDASKVVMAPCAAIASVLAGATCTLTTAEANAAPIKALAAKSDRACPVKDQRYLAGTSTGSNYYEIACENGSGFVVEANARGDYARTISCVQAAGISGGCKLIDAAAEVAKANDGYSSLIKAGGVDCAVNKVRAFQPKAGSSVTEIIEAGCANRPESVFALISGAKAEVLNCIRSSVEGYVCSYSKPEDSYPLLTENLRAAGRNTCTVSGARTMGVGRTAAYVEVACSDGLPGFVMSYPLGVGKPTEAIACGQAASIGGGCQLPTNKTS